MAKNKYTEILRRRLEYLERKDWSKVSVAVRVHEHRELTALHWAVGCLERALEAVDYHPMEVGE